VMTLVRNRPGVGCVGIDFGEAQAPPDSNGLLVRGKRLLTSARPLQSRSQRLKVFHERRQIVVRIDVGQAPPDINGLQGGDHRLLVLARTIRSRGQRVQGFRKRKHQDSRHVLLPAWVAYQEGSLDRS
jgi:hypothetical protein